MRQKEYLKARLTNDIFSLCLLQQNGKSPKEICEGLIKALRQYLDGDSDSIHAVMKMKVDDIDIDYFKGTPNSNKLEEYLKPALKEEIVEHFRSEAIRLLNEKEAVIKAAILRRIELLTWTNGLPNVASALEMFIDYLRNNPFKKQQAITTGDDKILEEKYNLAKEITIMERIKSNNNDDVIEFYNELMTQSARSAQNVIYECFYDFLKAYAEDESIQKVYRNISETAVFAKRVQGNFPNPEINAAFEEDYNRVVPADFYYRNVESIDQEEAFNIALLQIFAYNEKLMLEKGYIREHDVYIFSNPNLASPKELLATFSQCADNFFEDYVL